MAWRYQVDQVQIFERWNAKRQAAELAVFVERLNAFGAEGWEMIGFSTVPLVGPFSNNVKGYVHLCFFKLEVA